MPRHKYFLDPSDLQYKKVRLPWKSKLLRFALWFTGSVVLTIFYGSVFDSLFGSPKVHILNQEIEDLKLRYSLIERSIGYHAGIMANLEMSDENRYRPVLDMDTLPESFRSMGTGGVDRYEELEGYDNTSLMITLRSQVEDLKNRSTIQYESFKEIEETKTEWKREMEHLPLISPVNVIYRLGDGIKFREVHPVLGTPQWHHGQDISTPYGTEVFSTGAGTVIEAGWKGGFGNCVVVDHGYGYRSTYGHLSSISVTRGLNVKRGDKLGMTGSSGTSSGPHLHYQIDLYGQYKNPLYFFNDDLSEEEYLDMISTLSAQTRFR